MKPTVSILTLAAAAIAQTQLAGVQIAAGPAPVTRVSIAQAHQLCTGAQVKVESVNKTAFLMDGVTWVDTGYAILTPAARCRPTAAQIVVRRSTYAGGSLRFEFADMTDPAPYGSTAVVVVFLNIPPATAGALYTYRQIPSDQFTAEPGAITLRPREPIPIGAQIVIEYETLQTR